MKYWVFIGLLFFSTWVYAGTRVTVEGHGSSEAEAKQDAFDSAITQVVGQVIVGDKEASGDRLVKDFIGGYSAGYIENFEILETRKNPDRVTVKLSVSVASSKIAQRMLSRGYQVTPVNGLQIQAQLESQLAQRERGDILLSNVLASYPFNAFVVRADRTEVVIGARRQVTINVPYEISWSRFWLDALNETLGLIAVDSKSCGNFWIKQDNKLRISPRPGLSTMLTDTPCGQEADFRVRTSQTNSYYFYDKKTLELVNHQLQSPIGRQHIGLRVNILDAGGSIVDSGCVRIDAASFVGYTEPTNEVVHWNDRSRNLRPYIDGQGKYRDVLKMNITSTGEIDEMAKIDLTIEKTCT
jgi:hypothetical protein